MPKPEPRSSVSLVLRSCCAALLAVVSGCGPGGSTTPTTYAVTFSLATTPAPLQALSFNVVYQGGGGFDGQGGAVQCTRLGSAAGATSAFADDDIETLSADLTAGSTAMDAVSEVVRCLFSAKILPTTANFTVTVTKALDANNNDLKTQAQVLVTSIVADGGSDTDHFITLRVDSTHTTVGALQFEVDFLGAEGGFAVSNQTADCTNLAPDSVLAASVIAGQLRTALISLSGFNTPADVLRCRFVAATAPIADDFDITVSNAETVAGDPLEPDMSVSSITTGSGQ